MGDTRSKPQQNVEKPVDQGVSTNFAQAIDNELNEFLRNDAIENKQFFTKKNL